MNEPKYTFAKLRLHTKSIRNEAAPLLAQNILEIEQAFADFDGFIVELEESKTLEFNIKKILSCKFLNHIYSALILVESGLIVDAILCERNAIETLAFYWLVCLDSTAAEEYNDKNIARPVVVRQRLEKLGVDISHIKELYSWGSETSHVGRSSERFHSKWQDKSTGTLLFGGDFSSEDQLELFRFLPVLLYLFKEPMMVAKK